MTSLVWLPSMAKFGTTMLVTVVALSAAGNQRYRRLCSSRAPALAIMVPIMIKYFVWSILPVRVYSSSAHRRVNCGELSWTDRAGPTLKRLVESYLDLIEPATRLGASGTNQPSSSTVHYPPPPPPACVGQTSMRHHRHPRGVCGLLAVHTPEHPTWPGFAVVSKMSSFSVGS